LRRGRGSVSVRATVTPINAPLRARYKWAQAPDGPVLAVRKTAN
jgi:hypothetical protein